MTHRVYSQWDDIFHDFSLHEQMQATLDLLAYGMFVIDTSTDCLVDPRLVRINPTNTVHRPEQKHLLALQKHKLPKVTFDAPIWRRTDPGHG
jgi:hypothetical protein